ncbi:MAG: hypothetical protein KGI06_04380 [Candidatus Micrarchaeota archaeon]|nr:hypothetical protein [Candidatus Micrarchaeota archaeon]
MLKIAPNTRAIGIILALSFLIMQFGVLQFGAQPAQTITGLSVFDVSQSSATIYLNSSLAIPFTMRLTNGTSGTSYLIVANGAALQANGIYVGINPSSGSPSFNGTLYINTNINSSVVPGTYVLKIESGGADPLYPGVFNFTLTVMNTAVPITTPPISGHTTSYSVTSAPTTVTQSQGGGSLGGLSMSSLEIAGIIIVIIIIVIVLFAVSRKK